MRLQVQDGMTSREIRFEQLHKRKAAAMIAKVDDILKGLEKEFNSNSNIEIREVAFIIGPTIHCPKEVYIFKFPEAYPNKDLRKSVKSDLMRHVVLNPDFTNFISKPIQVTNMYVMVKKPKGDVATWICPTSNYKIPTRAPQVEIELLCDNPKCVNPQVDSILEKISGLNVSKSCCPHHILSQQNSKSNIAAQKRIYPEENNILDEMNTSLTSLLISNESLRNCPGVCESDNGTKDVIALTGNTLMQAPTSHQGDNPSHANCNAISAHENYDISKKELMLQNKTHKEGKPECVASMSNEPIWYITSEYLPYFKVPAISKCPNNKRIKH
ncbi:MAD2L1-binding protein [Gryllus bimaculatus]|nr:MAD2L1-binding protein [Gryllus bimaculatus]